MTRRSNAREGVTNPLAHPGGAGLGVVHEAEVQRVVGPGQRQPGETRGSGWSTKNDRPYHIDKREIGNSFVFALLVVDYYKPTIETGMSKQVWGFTGLDFKESSLQ